MEQGILQSMGLEAGVSDLIYLSDSGPVFIELKAGRNTQSDAQKEFEQVVTALGHHYHLIRSFDEFRNVINSYQ